MSQHRILTIWLTLTATLSSLLLFIVQPLAAKLLLPVLGGSAAVWNMSMVFFQATLLLGYLVAHAARRLPGHWRVAPSIVALGLGVLALPIAFPEGWEAPSTGHAGWVFAALAVMVGAPFFALATLSPTLQSWLAATDHPRASEPYFLYAAGNAGSVVALIAYPALVEPGLGAAAQGRWWMIGYVAVAVGVIGSALLCARRLAPSSPPVSDGQARVGISGSRRATWVLLAAVPSALLLAVTQFLTTDVASVPLLWVLPLLMYLLTFVVAFARPRERVPVVVIPVAIVAVGVLAGLQSARGVPISVSVPLAVGAFGAVALWCHMRLAVGRPTPDRLTEYWLLVSFGGLIGGITVALVAPLVFDRVLEYPLLLVVVVAVMALFPGRRIQPAITQLLAVVGALLVTSALVVVIARTSLDDRWLVVVSIVGVVLIWLASRQSVALSAPAIVLVVLLPLAWADSSVVFRSRSFYGALSVSAADGRHSFLHGTTLHGAQRWDPPSPEPLTYYSRDSGVGRVMLAVQDDLPAASVAVVGLGVGTLASYGRPTDSLQFFELDPAVVRIASDADWFTYISSSAASVGITVGDGRRTMSESTTPFDLIVLDAFSSDAIPTHLLTREAFAVYRDRLAPGGVIAVHISNRYFNLQPVITRIADEASWTAFELRTSTSRWMVLADETAGAAVSEELASWTAPELDDDAPLWTDDYTNLWATRTGW